MSLATPAKTGRSNPTYPIAARPPGLARLHRTIDGHGCAHEDAIALDAPRQSLTRDFWSHMSENRQLKRDMLALALVALAVFLGLSLATYDPADPPSHLTFPPQTETHNVCGPLGGAPRLRSSRRWGWGRITCRSRWAPWRSCCSPVPARHGVDAQHRLADFTCGVDDAAGHGRPLAVAGTGGGGGRILGCRRADRAANAPGHGRCLRRGSQCPALWTAVVQ